METAAASMFYTTKVEQLQLIRCEGGLTARGGRQKGGTQSSQQSVLHYECIASHFCSEVGYPPPVGSLPSMYSAAAPVAALVAFMLSLTRSFTRSC